MCGVDRRNVIAVGDNINDMTMIKAFRSYAMENGVKKLKRKANAITPSVTALIRKELAIENDTVLNQ
jgi:hydroxymethylpyrimidine pyrophosphatase-like HAD family hydrolase